MNSSGSSRRSSDLLKVPSLLTIVQDEIETVIPSESNEHLSVKKTKTSCGLNYKSLLQFGLMTFNLIFQSLFCTRNTTREYKYSPGLKLSAFILSYLK
jgi:hypothetical protein